MVDVKITLTFYIVGSNLATDSTVGTKPFPTNCELIQDEFEQLVDELVLDAAEVVDVAGAACEEQVRGSGSSASTVRGGEEQKRHRTFQNSVPVRVSDSDADCESCSAVAC